MNEFKSLAKETSSEITVNRSKFICYAYPVKHEIDATDYINKIRSMHKTAKHNVYAYKLVEYNKKRYSDDGEPHKTAGLPLLEIIEKNDLTNIVVVVTRYFGGVLLGTGGLVRAYSGVFLETLNRAKIVTFKFCDFLELVCPYNLYEKMSGVILSNSGVIDNTDFFEKVRIKFYIETFNTENLKKKLLEIGAGEINIKLIKTDFFPI